MSRGTRRVLIVAVPVVIVVAVAIAVLLTRTTDEIEFEPLPGETPDFASMTDVKAKKAAFFDYLLPHVLAANEQTLDNRFRIQQLASRLRAGETLTDGEVAWLEAMLATYRVFGGEPADLDTLSILLVRVDTIPVSLALAQAANESAWGTSRFARNGNNYFGIWCYSDDCGDIPLERDEGARHQVARFATVTEGVYYYVRLLNSHPAYSELRAIRQRLKKAGKPVTGVALAEGLIRYSERREAYVEEIRQMIRHNRLNRFNVPAT